MSVVNCKGHGILHTWRISKVSLMITTFVRNDSQNKQFLLKMLITALVLRFYFS